MHTFYNVQSLDFGRCEVNNSYGSDGHTFVVVRPGIPDAPHDLRVAATAVDSVTLVWNPGFDGGHNQSFVLLVLDQKTGRTVRDMVELQGGVING